MKLSDVFKIYTDGLRAGLPEHEAMQKADDVYQAAVALGKALAAARVSGTGNTEADDG